MLNFLNDRGKLINTPLTDKLFQVIIQWTNLFLGIDVAGIESYDDRGAVFEQVFYGLHKFDSSWVIFNFPQRFSILARPVFAEYVASAADPNRLNGESQILVV